MESEQFTGPIATESGEFDQNMELPADEAHSPLIEPAQPEKSPVNAIPGPSYKAQYVLSGHLRAISSLKFSPDGSTLASAGALYASTM